MMMKSNREMLTSMIGDLRVSNESLINSLINEEVGDIEVDLDEIDRVVYKLRSMIASIEHFG